GDQEWAGWNLVILGAVAWDSTGHVADMRRDTQPGLALFGAIVDHAGMAAALLFQSIAAQSENDLAAAEMYAAQSLAIERELGDEQRIVMQQQQRGDIARSRGDLALARACYEEALVLGRKLHFSQATNA